ALVGLVLVLGYYLYAWLTVGRDPPSGTIIPLFAPPEGMSAASVRYVKQMNFDDVCFTAAIVDLGVNGHLRMDGTGERPIIHRVASDKEIPRTERAMEQSLFRLNESVELAPGNHITLGKARFSLKAALARAYEDSLFADNFSWSLWGLISSIALVGLLV